MTENHKLTWSNLVPEQIQVAIYPPTLSLSPRRAMTSEHRSLLISEQTRVVSHLFHPPSRLDQPTRNQHCSTYRRRKTLSLKYSAWLKETRLKPIYRVEGLLERFLWLLSLGELCLFLLWESLSLLGERSRSYRPESAMFTITMTRAYVIQFAFHHFQQDGWLARTVKGSCQLWTCRFGLASKEVSSRISDNERTHSFFKVDAETEKKSSQT